MFRYVEETSIWATGISLQLETQIAKGTTRKMRVVYHESPVSEMENTKKFNKYLKEASSGHRFGC